MFETERVAQEASPWEEYYRRSCGFSLRPTLIFAFEQFGKEGNFPAIAIDLGCGAGHETMFLAERGWMVIAVDAEVLAADYLAAKNIQGDYRFVHSRMEDFLFPYNATLINASFAMPFCPPSEMESLVCRIRDALHPGGRFAGQFFGTHDSWASKPYMTFLTREELLRLFQGFEIEMLEELEYDQPPVVGNLKHWHIFHLVAKKS